jgi:hypothetical protein
MKLCSVERCCRKHYALGYCQRHYRQIQNYGTILERTKLDPNEIIIEDQICKMKLYNNYSEEIAETIFDLKYKSEIEKYKWSLTYYGYVVTSWFDKDNKQHNIQLHQAIISLSKQEVPDGYEIDHKDRNKLNNLEINLRICLHSENGKNQKTSSNNTSGYKGVYWKKTSKKWKVLIRVNNQLVYIGCFTIKEDAAKAYNKAAIKYYGEFAGLNEINEVGIYDY